MGQSDRPVMLYSFLRRNSHCEGTFFLPNGNACSCFPTFDQVKADYTRVFVRGYEEGSPWNELSESNYPDLLDSVGEFEIWGIPY